jgi:hypothetical protein
VEDDAGETWLMRDGHAAGILAALVADLVPVDPRERDRNHC